MKRILFLFLLSLAVCLTCACAQTSTPPQPEPDAPSVPSLIFVSDGNGSCYVSGLGTYAEATVRIPEVSPDGDTVTGIGAGVFTDGGDLTVTEVYIPKTVVNVAATAFEACTTIQAIHVDEENTSFTSVDGSLYTKNMVWLIKYASDEAQTSFSAPEGVLYVAAGAFNGAVNLQTVSFSADLRYIVSNAFKGCENLTDLHYDGTSASWNAVYVEPGNDALTNANCHFIEIENNTQGKVILCLDKSQAPLTVENFLTLVADGFYDGLTMHRIIEGFMIQGGDPKGNGTGGSANTIKGEFLDNGVHNTILHKRGVISMARSSAPDSASSQFFICHADASWLDGSYAAFGWVVEGMEVVDAIATVNYSFTDSNGSVPSAEQPTIVSARVLTDYEKAEAGYEYVELTFSYFSK